MRSIAVPLVLFMAVALLAPLPGSAPRAQTLYPMACMSGGNMSVILSPRGDRTMIQVRFAKARPAHREARPRPGECTWWDRPLNPREPTLMSLDVHAELWTQFRAVGASVASAGVVGGRGSRDDIETANFFARAVRSGRCFTVNTFNTGRGYFEVRSIADGC